MPGIAVAVVVIVGKEGLHVAPVIHTLVFVEFGQDGEGPGFGGGGVVVLMAAAAVTALEPDDASSGVHAAC